MEKQWNADSIRKMLKAVYSSPDVDKHLDSASDDELRRIVCSIKNGVHIATPVFDSAKEQDIRDLLTLTHLP